MRINTNLTAMNTYTQYTKNNSKISSAVAKLSSGYSINSAADNAAGLAISEKMRAQIRGLNQASTNSQDAISLTQTAEGALSSSTEILQRMREISVQSSNDTNNTKVDREALQDEFSQLQNELNDIASTTSFNKKNLLDGSLAKNTATITNMSMQKSGLSVELGNVDAGKYAFSVGVKQESAAVTGVKSEFTITNKSGDFKVGTINAGGTGIDKADEGKVTNNLSASSLANGNYTITAKYDTDNKNMTFTAAGDNGQTFTATLSQADLKAGLNNTTSKPMTLEFKNGDDTSAFTVGLMTTNTYDTTSDNVMTNLATQLTNGLSLSANKGVDAKDATYGLYAKMTGAKDVKLQAGMSSVTFDNGVKMDFDQLTTAQVDTTNLAATDDTKSFEGATHAATATTAAGKISYTNFKAADDNMTVKAGDAIAITGTANADGKTYDIKVTVGTTDYMANISKTALDASASFSKTGGTKTLSGVKFTSADGNSIKMDINNTVTALPAASADLNMAEGDFSVTSVASAVKTAPSHKADAVFGDAGTSSTFTVENKKGAGLTFQVGANEGDELVINVDKLDANYLGVASASVSTRESASKAITSVDNAINQVSSQRAYLGAIQNRLNYKISNLNTSSQNLTAAESQIRDVDMAKEMTEFTNANILSQAATSMLAQANSLPQNVLSLLK